MDKVEALKKILEQLEGKYAKDIEGNNVVDVLLQFTQCLNIFERTDIGYDGSEMSSEIGDRIVIPASGECIYRFGSVMFIEANFFVSNPKPIAAGEYILGTINTKYGIIGTWYAVCQVAYKNSDYGEMGLITIADTGYIYLTIYGETPKSIDRINVSTIVPVGGGDGYE